MTRTRLLRGSLLVGLAGFLAMAMIAPAAADAGFALKDAQGDHLDVLRDGRILARYMYAYDKSTPERAHETYKPYLHVFDAEGKGPITKGPGGTYTHHRGIFIGWCRISFDGKTFDRWHMKGGEIVHRAFTAQQARPDQATFTSATDWNDAAGQAFLKEERTMTFRPAPAPGRVVIDFAAKLTAPRGDVKLDGDPEHAGIQYRPAQEVDLQKTTYVFPVEKASPHKDLDYPWVGETYVLGGKEYSVVDMNHPDNPKKSSTSAYRNYGRFGMFPRVEIKSGQSLVVKYRFLVVDGPMPSAEVIQKCCDEFIGAASPTAVPKTCVLPAEGSKTPAKPKGDKPKADKKADKKAKKAK